ncbi:GntR family transcriptional regulator [Nonomuraea wenchangensis]
MRHRAVRVSTTARTRERTGEHCTARRTRVDRGPRRSEPVGYESSRLPPTWHGRTPCRTHRPRSFRVRSKRTRRDGVQAYGVISQRIRSGEIKVGARVPSLVDLGAEFGIANATAQKVIRQLRADGLIRTEPGSQRPPQG